MVDIDRWLNCISRTQTINGQEIEGHNFVPQHAYIRGEELHMPLYCKYCGLISDSWKRYEGESPAEIKELYGFTLDDGLQGV